MSAQSEKAREFASLHKHKGGFIIPNPWDRGTARILAHKGFKALATSSVAFANTLGRGDYEITREEALAHCRDIAAATDLPVTADLENGFADRPEDVADFILAAADTGIVGCSIEDRAGYREGAPGEPLYPLELAAERIHLAVTASRRLNFPFMITARTEEMLIGGKNMDEAIRRLRAFEKAGAHVVYATGLTSVDQVKQIKAVVRQAPLNVMGLKMLKTEDLFAAGAQRISLGPWFGRAALKGLLAAIDEVQTSGTFKFAETVPTGAEIVKMMG